MALQNQETQQIIKKFQRKELDTGSPEVQIALLTERIARLTEHFKAFKKDNHGRQGLFRLVSRRRKLLDYVRRTDVEKYSSLISELGLRK